VTEGVEFPSVTFVQRYVDIFLGELRERVYFVAFFVALREGEEECGWNRGEVVLGRVYRVLALVAGGLLGSGLGCRRKSSVHEFSS